MGLETNFISISDFSDFELVKIGTGNTAFVSASASAGNYAQGTNTTTIAHNLGYEPTMFVFLTVGTNYIPLPYITSSAASTSSAIWKSISADIDKTNILIIQDILVYGTTGLYGQFPFKYYLFKAKSKR